MSALRLCACFLAASAGMWAQGGTQPKPAAADYPVHAEAGKIALGAEYLVHSFSCNGETFFTDDYLIVEVGAYPPKGGQVELSAAQFMLRINGKKGVIYPDAPGFVGASLKYPDWESPRSLEAGVGMGDRDVIIGRPASKPRFPGDRRGTDRPLPPQRQTPAEAAVASALPQDAHAGAVSGHLYFRYKGKTKSLRKLELIYQQGDQQTVLRLL